MKDYEKSRKNYEQRKKSGDYDANMEYNKENDVESGAWVLITRQVPVEEKCKPHLFGIYWGIPKQDSYDRQVCVIHTTEDVTLLNHEFTVIDDERLRIYREEGWELRENNAAADTGLNTEHCTGWVRRTASGKGMETIKTRESLYQRGNEQKSEND